ARRGVAAPAPELLRPSVRESAVRTRYGLNVVGLKRDGVALEGSLAAEPLLMGDMSLVVGGRKGVSVLALIGGGCVLLWWSVG
ncbi:hypothetical protein C9F09_10000, partial [Salmonella enterica subsp. enterica serovar Wilhelmsburg]